MTTPAEPHSDYRLNVKKPSLLTLIVLISYGSIGTALFTPAIPAVMDHFHVSAGVSQLTIMIFLLGYSIGQLIYSPVAKKFWEEARVILRNYCFSSWKSSLHHLWTR